jgi:hypothetical protein
MHSGHNFSLAVICPHFKGSGEGAICDAAKELVRKIDEADIALCMSRHFEICRFYSIALGRQICKDFPRRTP